MTPRLHRSTNCLVLTRMLQAVMNMDYKLDQSLTFTLHSLVEQTSLHPWGFLSLNALYKDSFLVCIVTRRIEARNFLTHAAKGPWESMRCTIWESFGFNESRKVQKGRLTFYQLSKDFLAISFIITANLFFSFWARPIISFKLFPKNTVNSFVATLFIFWLIKKIVN